MKPGDKVQLKAYVPSDTNGDHILQHWFRNRKVMTVKDRCGNFENTVAISDGHKTVFANPENLKVLKEIEKEKEFIIFNSDFSVTIYSKTLVDAKERAKECCIERKEEFKITEVIAKCQPKKGVKWL